MLPVPDAPVPHAAPSGIVAAREPDDAVAVRASEGDGAALAELYTRHAPALYRRVILPRCGDVDLADEALAETFRVIAARIDTYVSHPAGPFPWLARIAHSRVMDVHRERRRRSKALADFSRLVGPLLPEAPFADEATRKREEALVHERVRATLDAIRPRYKRAIELRFYDELSRDACATALEVSVATFDVVLLRAMRAFRAEWEANLEEGGAR